MVCRGCWYVNQANRNFFGRRRHLRSRLLSRSTWIITRNDELVISFKSTKRGFYATFLKKLRKMVNVIEEPWRLVQRKCTPSVRSQTLENMFSSIDGNNDQNGSQ